MKHFKITSLIFSLVLVLFFEGCKKVIDVNLKNAGTQIVITGEVNNRPGPYHVIISKTVDFDSNNNFPPVSGAVVIITENGVANTLKEMEPGDYSTNAFTGKPGSTYQLYVDIEGQIYKATSTMPQPVHIDSITFMEGMKKNLYAVANFQDPPGEANFYQFKEYANGVEFPNGRGNSVFDDRLSDGRYINRLLYDDSTDIKSGIKLTVQMNCVDGNVYNYFNELYQISGNGGNFANPSPANPTSNISGGALGYFSANTRTARTVEIP